MHPLPEGAHSKLPARLSHLWHHFCDSQVHIPDHRQEIWSGQAHVNVSDLVKAKNAALANGTLHEPGQSETSKRVKPVTAGDIKPAEIAAMIKES